MLKRITFPQVFNWLIIAFVIYSNYSYEYWSNRQRIIEADVNSYYAYLPATFIYNDISLKFTNTQPDEVRTKIWYQTREDGTRVILTSCGLAYMYAPFFFGAHAFALLSDDYHANGYTDPYSFGLIVSSVFYFAMGLYYLRKILSRYFPPGIVVFTCLLIGIGTNLFYYVTTEPTMSHAYSFCLLAAFIYFTLRWHEKPNIKYSIILGFLTGLISLTRPTNIIIVLLFILWNVSSFKDVGARVRLLLQQYKFILLIGVCAFAVWIPQMIYWKILTGHFFYDCYGDENRFFFNDPKIFKGLFSYRKGWLLYTPIMAFALVGIAFLRKRVSELFLPILFFVVLNIYIILSWWCWWYGGGFGLRAFIDSYALMAIPLAALLFYVFQKSKIGFSFLVAVLLVLVSFYQFQNAQYRQGSIHWDSMGKRLYWANFGKIPAVPNYEQLLEPIDYEKARKGER